MDKHLELKWDKAVTVVRAGGVLAYPTETLYALGCNARDESAVHRVAMVKGRPSGKPMPLIVGAMEQLPLVACTVKAEERELMQRFWPGPLTLLLQAAEGLSSLVRDRDGQVAVRWTAHPLAARLCVEAGCPIVATSCNLAGCPAASRPEEVDSSLLLKTEGLLADRPWPAGGLPSTVAEVTGPGQIRIFRLGAVSVEELSWAGYRMESAE
jgi:L-threonylcarbamoyladenylate synthase